MHDTARCLGYPSDSSRSARERARETTCGRHLRRGRSGAAGLDTASSGLCGLSPRPCGLPLRECGSPLSHLAGVGQCPLAISHGCLVGLLVGVLDRLPVSPLPSTSACSGTGSGWHGCGWIADSAVYSEGLVPVAPAFARACSAGPSPCGGSPASRGLAGLGDTGLSAACQLAGTTADALSAKSAVSPSRDPWGPGQV
jgi:hypothetical protein